MNAPQNYVIILNGDMSQQIISNPVDLTGWDGYSMQASWLSGSPTGQFYLECSCDPGFISPLTIWTPIGSSVFNVAGTTGNDMWNILTARYRWVHLVWQPTVVGMGSGVLNVNATVK